MTKTLILLASFLLAPNLPAADAGLGLSTQPSAAEIVDRMLHADLARASQLEGYTATRVYRLVNPRFRKQAQITARITYRRPGEKSFEVVSEEGSHLICERVLRRVIGAETDASKDSNRDQARINLVNYDLKMLGTEAKEGRTFYVLELEPKSKSPYLVKGRAWIDATEYALVRMEGTVAKKPSIWVGSPVVTQTYSRSGPFWLPERNFSTTDAPVFGKTDLSIESTSYEVRRGVAAEPLAGRIGN